MAIFYLDVKPLKRSDGRSAVAAAAYRAAVRLTDQTTGKNFDYSKKHDNVFKSECFIIQDGQKIKVDRGELWNESEQVEKRKDARTAREIIINLPHEVSDDHREILVNQFTEQLAKRYKVAIDWSIHLPDTGGDQRNHHAHILMTTRTAELKNNKICLNEKSLLELSNTKLTKLNQPLTKDQITEIRSNFATLTNELLESLGIDERIDHRSNAERGIAALTTKKLGVQAAAMERKGIQTTKGDYNRAVKQINAQNAQERENERELTDQLNNAVIELEQETSRAESTITNETNNYQQRKREFNEFISEGKERVATTKQRKQRTAELSDQASRTDKEIGELAERVTAKKAAQQADNNILNTPINRLFKFKVAMQRNDPRTITNTMIAYDYLTNKIENKLHFERANLTCLFDRTQLPKPINDLNKMSSLAKKVFNSLVNGKSSLNLNDKSFTDFSTLNAREYLEKYKIKYNSESDRNELKQLYEHDRKEFEQYQAKHQPQPQMAEQVAPDQPKQIEKAAPQLEQEPGQVTRPKYKP